MIAAIADEGVLGTEPPVDVETRAQRIRDQLAQQPHAAMWVVEEDGRVVGGGDVGETRIPGVLTLGLALLPEARGKGSGRALMEEMIAHARATGAHKLELEVWPDNGRAVALYSSLGFEVEGFRRDHYRRRDGSLRSSLLMARRFSDGTGGS